MNVSSESKISVKEMDECLETNALLVVLSLFCQTIFFLKANDLLCNTGFSPSIQIYRKKKLQILWCYAWFCENKFIGVSLLYGTQGPISAATWWEEFSVLCFSCGPG